MINHHNVLEELFDKTITVKFNGKSWSVKFTEGDLFELTKVLDDAKTKYPIIWLQNGYTVQQNQISGKTALSGVKMFLITKGSENDWYKKRYKTTYQEILYPLFENIKKTVKKSEGVIITNEVIDYVDYPFNDTNELNRTDGKPQKTTIGDIWDAVLIQNLNLSIDECHYSNHLIKI